MLDQAMSATLRNFSTMFLLVAVLAVPLHFGHAFVYRDVIAVSEIHPAIESFPPARLVQGVGRDRLAAWRSTGHVLTAVELALFPLLVLAARRILDLDEDGEVPTVPRAWSTLRSSPAPPVDAQLLPPVVVAAVFAFAVAVLARAAGSMLVELLADRLRWAGVGLVEGSARSLGGAFLVGMAASLTRPGTEPAEDT